MDALSARHGAPVVVPSGAHEHRMAATLAAMEAGAPLIAQAALADRSWIGYADFLVLVAEPGPHWAWSYEPWADWWLLPRWRSIWLAPYGW